MRSAPGVPIVAIMKMNGRSEKQKSRSSGALRTRRRNAAADVLLEAAEAVIAAKGYERATLQDIAKNAGCAAGTVYLYFKNKEILYNAMVTRHTTELAARCGSAFDGKHDALGSHRLFLGEIVAYFNAHRAFFRIFYTAGPSGRAHLESNLHDDALGALEKSKAKALAAYKIGQRAGLIRSDVDAAELCAFVDAVLMCTLARWSIDGVKLTEPEQVDLLWRLTTGGLVGEARS